MTTCRFLVCIQTTTTIPSPITKTTKTEEQQKPAVLRQNFVVIVQYAPPPCPTGPQLLTKSMQILLCCHRYKNLRQISIPYRGKSNMYP